MLVEWHTMVETEPPLRCKPFDQRLVHLFDTSLNELKLGPFTLTEGTHAVDETVVPLLRLSPHELDPVEVGAVRHIAQDFDVDLRVSSDSKHLW